MSGIRPCGLALLAALTFATPAGAIDAPYDSRLLRLGEILGSLHYLRNLCGEEGDEWRQQMQALIESEAAGGERRTRLVASFNRGYRAFSTIHVTCTASTAAVIERYMKEGEALSREIANLFGN